MKHSFLKEGLTWLLIALAVGLGINTWRVNAALKARNQELARQAIDPLPGVFVPRVHASTTDDELTVLGEEGELQVLVFFNETCPYCRASTAAWRQVSEELPNGVAMYGVSFDSAAAAATYRTTYGLPFPVVSQPTARFAAVFRVPSVPLVMVVGPDGRIGYSRKGVLETAVAVDSVVSSIENLRQAVPAQQTTKGVASGG